MDQKCDVCEEFFPEWELQAYDGDDYVCKECIRYDLEYQEGQLNDRDMGASG